MSNICPNCGTVNNDQSKFCMNCGTSLQTSQNSYSQQSGASTGYGDPYRYQQNPVRQPYGGYQQNTYPYEQPQYPQQYPLTPAPKKRKTGVKIVVSLIALVLVAALVLVVVLPLAAHIDVFGLHLFDNSPKQVTERLLKAAYVDYDAKEVVDCLYEAKYATGDNQIGESDVAQLQSILDKLKSTVEENNATITYNILDEYYVETDDYDEYIEEIQDEGADTSKIEKMIEVDFTLRALGETSDPITLMCVKAEGKWYVCAASMIDMMSRL